MKTGNWIIRNLILGAALVAGILLCADLFLSIRTRHGQELTLPDFTSMTFQEASELAERIGVRAVAGDSVYIARMRKDGVYSQNPRPGSKVKKGRRVIMSVNSRTPELIVMPSLVGYQLRQAKSELLSHGLKLGTLYYERDIATNNVLNQYFNGSAIEPGTKVRTGSTIDLILGLSEAESYTYAPKLIGMDYARAIDLIQDNSLNVGKVIFDRNVKTYRDSLQSVVYQQNPGFSGTLLRMGSRVNIRLTMDRSKLEK